MSTKPPRVWRVLLVYWLIQPVAIGTVFVLWMMATPGERWLYLTDEPGEMLTILLDPGYWMNVGLVSLVVTAAQACYLWPARKPGITTGHGRSVRLSLATAGLLAGLGGIGLVVGLIAISERWVIAIGDIYDALPWSAVASFWLGMLALVWVVPTLLLIRFCGRGRREDVLGRTANRVLLGTSAEVLLLIPVDVMIR
ncbi:MAG: hypothetical protein AAGA55_02310 [Planctomycetota bacterium]